MKAFKTTSQNKLILCITDRSDIRTFDTSNNQMKVTGKLELGFYQIGNNNINQEFIPVQKVESYDNAVYNVKSSHINHGILFKTLSFLHN